MIGTKLVLAMIIYNLTLRYKTIDKLANWVGQCSTRPSQQKSLHTTNEPMRSTIMLREMLIDVSTQERNINVESSIQNLMYAPENTLH